ncbi:MAG: CHAT domain-containing protein, partial [Acidobacteriota bacterium]|nr:CHAT domain-containing protein [Acidobacteriota bacterium]
DPIAAEIGGVETVLLVPEASLHQVVFAALPVQEEGRFLVERGPRIHLLGGARDVVRFVREGAKESGSGLLAVADPAFASPRAGAAHRSTDLCSAVFAGPWEPLPASAVEVRRIRELFSETESVDLLLGEEATERALQDKAAGRRVLHIATHGYFVAPDCEAEEGRAPVPPLLRSGLVLARAGDDDGILTAEELTALDLDGAEIVVLSGCDTGLGEIDVGEGVYGLRRAFELAGARTVVMTLWSVPDRQALAWMTSFYERLLDGARAGDAAHDASLSLLERLRAQRRPPHPWLWTGFVTAGDWRVP